MIPLLSGWLAKRWVKWLLLGLLVAAITGVGWWVRSLKADSDELARIKPQYEAMLQAQAKANENVEKLAPVDDRAARDLVEAKAVIARQAGELSRAWGRVDALQETLDEATGCPVVRLSDEWGMFFSATTTGIATDTSSSEADRSDGSVPPG